MVNFTPMQNSYDRFRYFAAKTVNLVIVVAALVMFSMWAAKANAHDEMVEQQIAEAERAANRGPYATDGSFEGSAKGYGGQVKMRVAIENGYIDAVEIVDASSEDQAWLDMCVGLPAKIVKEQTTSIDVVSGATYTSAGMLNGATEALQKSMAGEA